MCYSLLLFCFLPSIVLGFVSDGASGFDRYCETSVWRHGPTLGFSALLFVGVMFFPSFPLWGLCCSLVLPIDGTGLGNVFGGDGMLQRENFYVPLSPLFLSSPLFFLSPFSLSPSPSFSLYPFLSLSLSPFLSLSLSCGFCLD